MRDLSDFLSKRIIDYKKLIEYGFEKQDDSYVYKSKIFDGEFEITVEFSKNSGTSKVFDLINEDEYVLVDVQDSTGSFVGKVREQYEEKLNDIINKCTIKDIYKSEQSKVVIKYIRDKYDDELEFLWEKLSDTAIWRNKQNDKWYGIMFILTERKLGLDSDRIIDAINLRVKKDSVNTIADNKIIFPGFHMNKKSWITIKLDNSMPIEKILELIDESYRLSVGK